MLVAVASRHDADADIRITFDYALFVSRKAVLANRNPDRDALLAVRAVRPVNIASGTAKTVLNQLVIGVHVHVHMGIRKRANRFAVIQVAARLGRGSKEIEFYLIVHEPEPFDSIYLV